ncbi:RUN domain-containing protein [Trichostrongylus colubriformis]|uniref:RUN domain-containing protein n=1 Tax=Trichostrongylus colubriformis TaxID=6319 RepID=A0AAN8FQ58_TRICO
MSTFSNREKSKTGIIKELETVLNAAKSSTYTTKDCISSEITQNICNVIEAIFIHGLRDPFFIKGSRYAKYPEPNFWPFVSKYSHKSITSEINSLKQIKSEIGRGRAWIRIVVNQNSLEHYVRLLLGEAKAINQFYDENALFLDAEQMANVCDLLKNLDQLPICAAVNSSFLNSWTPSPLILAGLVDGKPLKVGALAPRQRSSSLRDNSMEVGMSAIDFLQSERSTLVLSPIYGKERHSRKIIHSDDDESVYSHPSMINDSEKIPDRIILSSSPLNNGYNELPPQNVAPIIVSRRTRAPRRSSRSSSESHSRGSHSQSEQTSVLAGGLSELETSISATQTRMRPSETLDSGIDSEHRDPNAETISSVSDDKGRELINASLSPIKATEEQSMAGTDILSNKFNGSGTDPPVTTLLETLHPSEEVSAVPVNRHEQYTQSPKASDDMPDEVFHDGTRASEDQNSSSVLIPQAEIREQPIYGTSLHDELIFADIRPGSNSLLSRTWKTPKTTSSEPERSGSALLSSSSDTDADGGIVSFDQALRSAMETNGSPDKEYDLDDTRELGFETDVEDIDDESKSPPRKESTADQVTAKLTTISREGGLDSQDFRCPMCRKSIGAAFSKYELHFSVCGIDGLYYCSDCMRGGGEMPVPARILRSWDWKPRAVSDRGRAFIEANQDNVIFRIDQHNPTLYNHVPLLKAMKGLREKLQIASMYLFNCRESIAEDFRRRVWPRDHLYKDIHAYSISDLYQLHSGLLEKQVRGFLKHAIDHVMHCSLCRQKGFICEICDSREVIYPFQTETTYRCPHCFSVYHVECERRLDDCPKCVRRAKYEIHQEANDLPLG